MVARMEDVSKFFHDFFHEVTSTYYAFVRKSGIDETFHSAAEQLYAYPIDNTLLIVYFTMLTVKIRTSQDGHFASTNPFGSLLSTVILCFAGSIIQNTLLGFSPLLSFTRTYVVLLSCLIWYLVFFFPLDLFLRIVTFLPIKVIMTVLKEVYRVKCIHLGVQSAFSNFPDSWFVIFAIGSIRGCGSLVLRPFVHQIVGLGQPTIEFHRPSFGTKLSMYTSLAFTLQLKNVINISLASISLIFTLVFITFSILFLYTDQKDPLVLFENAFASIFLREPKEKATISSNERKQKSD